jgi:hypothetical protein
MTVLNSTVFIGLESFVASLRYKKADNCSEEIYTTLKPLQIEKYCKRPMLNLT